MAGIAPLRDRMDEVTLEMVRLLKERTEIASEIGALKRDAGVGVADEAREGALRRRVAALCGEIGLDHSIASRFLNALLNESVMVQSEGRPTHLSVFARARELERRGRRIIHMEVGEPDFGPPATVADALGGAVGAGMFRYGDAAGRPELREAIAAHASQWGRAVDPGEVMVCPGGRFAVFAAMVSLLDPGDEVIVVEPAWPAYRDCALQAGAKVRAVPTSLEGGWEPSPEAVRGAVSENTRMLVFNYPNNPTGKVLPAALQDELIGIASEHGLYVLSDEIYAEYAGGGWKSVLGHGYEKSIVVQSFSKSHAMTGMRIGYAVAGPEAISRMCRLQALCMTSVAEPIQHAALAALAAGAPGNAALIRRRLGVLAGRAREAGLEFAEPDGAMYLFARTGMDGTALAGEALERGLAVAPGEGFGNYGGFVRLSACRDEKTLIEGVDILGGIMGERA